MGRDDEAILFALYFEDDPTRPAGVTITVVSDDPPTLRVESNVIPHHMLGGFLAEVADEIGDAHDRGEHMQVELGGDDDGDRPD